MTRAIHLFAFLFVLITPRTAFSQPAILNPGVWDRGDIINTTTYVLLLNDEVFNAALRNAMEDWLITKEVIFVEPGETAGDVQDPGNTFIGFADVLHGPRVDRMLSFWRGGPDWESEENGMVDFGKWFRNAIAYWVLDTYGQEIANERVTWRVPLIMGSLEQGLAYIKNKGVRKASFSQVAEADAGLVQGKTLLVRSGRLDEQQLSALQNAYAWPVKVVDKAEIEQAIAERDGQVAILCPVQGIMPTMLVYDAASHKVVYYEAIMYAQQIKPSHLKAMARALSAK